MSIFKLLFGILLLIYIILQIHVHIVLWTLWIILILVIENCYYDKKFSFFAPQLILCEYFSIQLILQYRIAYL